MIGGLGAELRGGFFLEDITFATFILFIFSEDSYRMKPRSVHAMSIVCMFISTLGLKNKTNNETAAG